MANNIEEFESTDLVTMANVNEKINATNVALQALSQTVASGVKIATGSYTGTGTYGASNPNTLTFDFEPKLVMIRDTTGHKLMIFFGNILTTTDSSTNGFGYDVTGITISGSQLSWYSKESAGCQANGNNSVYYYIAIG